MGGGVDAMRQTCGIETVVSHAALLFVCFLIIYVQ